MILFWLIRRVVKLDVCHCVVGITVTNDGPGKGAKIKRLRGREKKWQKLWDESYQCIVGKKVLLSFAFAFVFVATFLRRLSDWFVRWLWWLHRSTAVRYMMIVFVCVCVRRSLRLQFCVFLSLLMQNTLKCVVGRDDGDSKRKLNCFDTFVNVWCCGVAQWWCDGDDSLVTVIQLYFDSVVTPINAISFICFCYSVLIILFICVNTFTNWPNRLCPFAVVTTGWILCLLFWNENCCCCIHLENDRSIPIRNCFSRTCKVTRCGDGGRARAAGANKLKRDSLYHFITHQFELNSRMMKMGSIDEVLLAVIFIAFARSRDLIEFALIMV